MNTLLYPAREIHPGRYFSHTPEKKGGYKCLGVSVSFFSPIIPQGYSVGAHGVQVAIS